MKPILAHSLKLGSEPSENFKTFKVSLLVSWKECQKQIGSNRYFNCKVICINVHVHLHISHKCRLITEKLDCNPVNPRIKSNAWALIIWQRLLIFPVEYSNQFEVQLQWDFCCLNSNAVRHEMICLFKDSVIRRIHCLIHSFCHSFLIQHLPYV